jgi:hypothetical protein
MRIVVEETTDPTTVMPCGSYGKGETQDYTVLVTSPTNDVGVFQLLNPGDSLGVTCTNPAQLVTVAIKNYGTVAQTNVPVTTIIQNGSTTVATFSTICPDTIPALSTVVYTYQSTFNAVGGNTYTFTSFTSLSTDQRSSNDTNSLSISFTAGGDSAIGKAELCGTDSVFFSATITDSNNLAFWYDSANGVNPIAIGNHASSSVITPNHKYYVGFNSGSLNVGPANKLVYPNGGYNDFSGNFVAFTNKVPLTIESARLYIGSAGTINFTVGDLISVDTTTGEYEYYEESSNTLNVYPTTPDPIANGTSINPIADTGAIYYLDLQVPDTGLHIIIIDCENGANIFRNNELPANPYPLGIPGVFTFAGNSAIMAGQPTLYQKYYYFFYDMNLQLNNCPGARSIVIAQQPTAPVISLKNDVLTSTPAASYQWYLNGLPIVNKISISDTAILSGNYTVAATDSVGCTLMSNSIDYKSASGTGAIQLLVSPNPNNGQFQLQFVTATSDNVYVTLTNTLGQRVYEASYPNFSGIFNQQIYVGYLSADVYYLKVFVGSNSYLQKIIIR